MVSVRLDRLRDMVPPRAVDGAAAAAAAAAAGAGAPAVAAADPNAALFCECGLGTRCVRGYAVMEEWGVGGGGEPGGNNDDAESTGAHERTRAHVRIFVHPPH